MPSAPAPLIMRAPRQPLLHRNDATRSKPRHQHSPPPRTRSPNGISGSGGRARGRMVDPAGIRHAHRGHHLPSPSPARGKSTQKKHDSKHGETKDKLAVIRGVREHHPDSALWLAGFSFGAYVALQAAQRVDVDRLITVAPPVNLYDFSDLAAPECPWLLIQGTADEVVPCREVAKWASRLYPAPEGVYLDGIDHYFHGKLNTLQSLLNDRITTHTLSRRAAHIA